MILLKASKLVSTKLLSTTSFSAAAAKRSYKTAVVTGGATGLGEAISRRLASDGYLVTIADVNVEAGEALALDLNNGSIFIKTDVRQPAQVEAAIQQAVETSKNNDNQTLDALVNNAGVVGPQLRYSEYDIEEWKRIIDINLNGTFYGLKYGLAQMEKQDTGGSIVNLSSTAGYRGFQNLGPYTATKFAVRGMTMAAAVEYGHKRIRVNAIAPTSIETPMVKGFIEMSSDPEAVKGVVTAMNAIPEFPQPIDVANACAFLLSDNAKYITGHTLPVDAGALSRVANSPEQQW